jgi:hypothetical protein
LVFAPPSRPATAARGRLPRAGDRGCLFQSLFGAAALILSAPLLSACADNGEAAATDTQLCDRDCIIGVTDRYLAALASNSTAGVPFAANVRFVENLKPLKPGEGLWQTVSGGKTGFSIYVPDPALQQAGWMGVVENAGKPIILALRLKLKGGEITEAEHIYADPAGGRLDNLESPRPGLLRIVEPGGRLPHDELMRIGAAYYSALDSNDGSLAPFAADCQRIENGLIAAGEGKQSPQITSATGVTVANDCRSQIDSQAFVYIDRIDNRRMIAADPVTGLAMGFSQFRHSMANLPYKVALSDGSTAERNRTNMPYDPFDMPAAHIFKIGPEGQIHEIEAVGTVAPYNSPTGWE